MGFCFISSYDLFFYVFKGSIANTSYYLINFFSYLVEFQDSIEPTLQIKFQTEKLSRTIQKCDDISLLKEIALELLKLNQQKSAIAHWTTLKALESQTSKINMQDFLKE